MASIDVFVDGRSVIHGPLMQTGPGEYLYFSTCFRRKKVEIGAVSVAEGQKLQTNKSAWLENRAWIVITRVRGLDGEPSLEMEISYEEPAWRSDSVSRRE